jgi:predicted RNA-binding protein Jag
MINMQVFLKTFFEGLSIQIDKLEVTEQGEDLSIRIETPDSPLLIGIHGKNMEALNHLLGRISEKQLGRYMHVHLEVNDYMKAKDERLFRFLDSKILFVMSSGKTVRMPNLSSFERKKAHNYIAEKDIAWLSTRSEGEWNLRSLSLSYTGALVEPTISSHTPSHQDRPTERVMIDLSEDGVGI